MLHGGMSGFKIFEFLVCVNLGLLLGGIHSRSVIILGYTGNTITCWKYTRHKTSLSSVKRRYFYVSLHAKVGDI